MTEKKLMCIVCLLCLDIIDGNLGVLTLCFKPVISKLLIIVKTFEHVPSQYSFINL